VIEQRSKPHDVRPTVIMAYGKERLLLATLLLLAAGTVLSAVSNSLGVVIAGRFI
jgi:predicted MFS family arabinose efflux permease